MTTWKAQLEEAAGDEKIIACTLTEEELGREFDNGYGGEEGMPFTAWSETRVFFPICYDGSEWVGSAPRNPCNEATPHQGGG
jgi:hypothetical protein